MKTLFTIGFGPTRDLWNHQPQAGPFLGWGRPQLGQAAAYGAVPTGTLTESQRNDVYALLKDAVTKGSEIDAWIHAVGEDGQRSALGSNFDGFRSYINRAADLAETAYPVYQRLGSDNQEDWWIADEDGNKIVEFVNTIASAYQMFSSKGRAGGVATPAVTVPKGAPAPAPGKLPTAAKPASTGIMPEPKILGVPQNQFLIGAGVVAGIGILAAALA